MRIGVACTALSAFAPVAAPASTWTVDDDRIQCPNAAFGSIQAAVDQAAPWDTLVICDGTYEEQSTPASGAGSPSQPGSLNGLTITKPLTLKGAGAAKVTIRPSSSLTTLAGSAPYLRDGGGNVVTVSRQSRDATDRNTMFVDISGVTITSGTTYAEAGVAFFNASGAIRDSVVGPLVRAADAGELAARPHGWGVVVANSQQGAEAGPRREVAIERSRVFGYQSGGVLFDDARGPDGAPETLQRSGIVSYGYVRDSSVEGSGPDALIPQTGVRYHAGQRGAISGSVIAGNSYTPDLRSSAGVLLTDAETGTDPANPVQRAFSISDSSLTGNGYGLFNANAANDAVRHGAPAAASLGVTGSEVFWGCTTGPVIGVPSGATCQGASGSDAGGAASVQLGFVRRVAPPFAAVPGATADDAPTARFGEPSGGTIAVGEPLDPVVVARDDFGVRSVAVTFDGDPLGRLASAPYEFSTGWTPDYADIDAVVEVAATVVDSAGQETVVTEEVVVVPPAGYEPIALDTLDAAFGAVLLGEGAERTVTIANSGGNPLTLGPLDVAGAGFAVAGGSCAAGAVLEVGDTCTLVARFAPAVAGAASGTLTVSYDALGGGDPAVVALSGAGVEPPPVERREPVVVLDPPARPVTPVAPAPTAAPRVTGSATVGGTLTCAPGRWSGAPTSLAYQWLRDGAPIAGASAATYRLVRADTGARVSCRVLAANAAGVGGPALAPGVLVSLPRRTTRSAIVAQAGAAIATFPRIAVVGGDGRVGVVRVACMRTSGCTLKLTGRLAIGRSSARVALTREVAGGRSALLTLRLGARARRALASRGRGTLALALVAGDGARATATVRVTER
ncbi:hypothetical protein Cwoe_4263 [Conexibacter woesei DSM 14684]|uniref:Ig-like domain-containing protein n=1 Tax=Conexibacter woesei (strain DSM 14684 / CCUG 47730 / CIP 108061 / JCM 11494 / NBRC 100937 / ID131577) TaxID=469383 RepID=D3F5X8_CONWI|nr:hypothetical protein Cwoe_4263 [Conexibacter woesei DSM 14684]